MPSTRTPVELSTRCGNCARLWAETDGLKLAHVAYKGSGQAINDLVAGHVKMGAITWTAAIGQMRGGTIVPLIESGALPDSPAARIDPNVPTSPFSGVVSINIRYPDPTTGVAQSFICSGSMVSA